MEHSTKQFKLIVIVNGEREIKYVRAETIEEAKQKLIDQGFQLCNPCNE